MESFFAKVIKMVAVDISLLFMAVGMQSCPSQYFFAKFLKHKPLATI